MEHANDNDLEFTPFPKIARLRRDCTITEKIDGTNAQVHIRPWTGLAKTSMDTAVDGFLIRAGSRSRWLGHEKANDNYGFGAWVREHATMLAALGEGSHFGEWWGQGIQRGYGAKEKRFSLFNVARWGDDRPACCHLVPVLYRGAFDSGRINSFLGDLRRDGSVAAPGFMRPEGIVVWHGAAQRLFKVTIEGDDAPKSLAKVAA